MEKVGAGGYEKGDQAADKRVGICKIIGCENKQYRNRFCKDHSVKIVYEEEWEPSFYFGWRGWKIKVMGHPIAPSKKMVTLDKYIRFEKHGHMMPCEVCGNQISITNAPTWRKRTGVKNGIITTKTVVTCQKCRAKYKEYLEDGGVPKEVKLPHEHVREIWRWFDAMAK